MSLSFTNELLGLGADRSLRILYLRVAFVWKRLVSRVFPFQDIQHIYRPNIIWRACNKPFPHDFDFFCLVSLWPLKATLKCAITVCAIQWSFPTLIGVRLAWSGSLIWYNPTSLLSQDNSILYNKHNRFLSTLLAWAPLDGFLHLPELECNASEAHSGYSAMGQLILTIIIWLCLIRTGNYQIHEFDWLKRILTAV